MSIAIGLDFGSLGHRAAYIFDDQLVSVPMPPDETTWHGLVFVDANPQAAPLGLEFSSLKYQLGTGKSFNWRGGTTTPEQAVLEIFRQLRGAVETYAGEEIGQAVIAVPAQYLGSRRALVRELGEEAGFGSVDLINDCTAAALGYVHDLEEKPRTMLLYSMGFVGFEVSLVRHAHQKLRELFHEGSRSPSGSDFDVLTMAIAIEELRRQNLPLPIKVYTSQWFDFRILAAELKEQLADEEAILQLPTYLTGTDVIGLRFRRPDFERAIEPQVEATIDSVEQVLAEAQMEPTDIDEVILVGGSTRIGLIQNRLEELFGAKPIQPRDDIIARGAAVQAHRLAREGGGSSTVQLAEQPSEPRPLPAPDLEPLFLHARRLAEAGERETAANFLEEIERRSRALREELVGG